MKTWKKVLLGVGAVGGVALVAATARAGAQAREPLFSPKPPPTLNQLQIAASIGQRVMVHFSQLSGLFFGPKPPANPANIDLVAVLITAIPPNIDATGPDPLRMYGQLVDPRFPSSADEFAFRRDDIDSIIK